MKMNKKALICSFSGICLAMSIQTVLAAPPAKAPAAPAKAATETLVPMSTVLQNLKMNGYEIISKIELDKEVFDINAISPQGKEIPIIMNAHTGELTSPKENPIPHVSLSDAVKRVEGSGYHNISMVEYNGSKYIVRTLDQKNKKVKLKIDGNTGEITKAWF